MSGVLGFGAMAEGSLASASLEVAAAGKRLADQLGQPLVGGLIGSGVQQAAQEFLTGGMETLYVVDGPEFHPYSSDAYVAAARAVIGRADPDVVLFTHNLDTREWTPRLAFQLQSALITDCIALRVEGGEVLMTKPIYGGSAIGEFAITGRPAMATLRARAFEAAPGEAGGRIETVEASQPGSRVTVLDEVQETVGSGPSLKDAKVVVSGGRGVGGPENWHLVEEVASVLGAAVGASRAVTDAGWVPAWHQVGLTGTSIAPDLYITIGISGAVQHLAGISGAKTVVAINRDPEADIFKHARFGVVGDAMKVVPAFVGRLKELRG